MAFYLYFAFCISSFPLRVPSKRVPQANCNLTNHVVLPQISVLQNSHHDDPKRAIAQKMEWDFFSGRLPIVSGCSKAGHGYWRILRIFKY